jgi:electron transport complex protein RnfG
MKNILSVTLKLLVITLVAAAALGAVNYVTAGPIAEQAAKKALEARQSAFPDAADFKALYDPDLEGLKDVTLQSLLGADTLPDGYGIITNVYAALDAGGNDIGIVAGVVTKGFNSGLHITIGIAADGTIAGVVVGDNTETAGLGAKAKESWFQDQYAGKQSPLKIVKANPGEGEVQAITGATITTKGVTNAVNTVSEFYATLAGGAQ